MAFSETICSQQSSGGFSASSGKQRRATRSIAAHYSFQRSCIAAFCGSNLNSGHSLAPQKCITFASHSSDNASIDEDEEKEEFPPLKEIRVKGSLKLLEDFDGVKKVPPVYRWGGIFNHITPLKTIKWAIVLLISWQAALLARATIKATILSPTVIMYTSWFLIIWPIPVVIILAIWTLAIATRQNSSRAKIWEQVVMLTTGLTWLILVPFRLFWGTVEGWPLTLFVFYFAFFCIRGIMTIRTKGKLTPREKDKQWATKTSRLAQVSFVVSLVSAHWMAAKEALNPGRIVPWSNTLAWCLMIAAFWLHWEASFYLGKYFDRINTPKQLITVGPYRFARHPIYTSYMLLFAGFCIAVRSYFSLVFVMAACVLYYTYRVKLEEDLLTENFGDYYSDYKEQTPKQFIPFIV